MYYAADKMLGHLVKVTPSSKVVGDLALQLVGMDVDPAEFEADPRKFDIPASVINFLAGELGTPPAGWPEPFRTKALEGRTVNPAAEEPSAEGRAALEQPGAGRRATLNRLLFPGRTKDFESSRTKYGDVSVLHTRDFLYGLDQDHEHVISLGKGVRLLVTLQAISEPDEKGMRTVMVTLNGQLRLLEIRDESVKSQAVETEKADTSQPGHVAAPFAGAVTVTVSEGDTVSAGDSVATIEAMKMEASITAPVGGAGSRVALADTAHVSGGDLVLVIDPQ